MDNKGGISYKRKASNKKIVKTVFATTITLVLSGSILQAANASSLPNRESIKFLERKDQRYAIINFSNKECKISGAAAKQAD